MSSRSGSARVPSSSATWPFTTTRPWRMSSSATRREDTPAWDRIFWSRTPLGADLLALVIFVFVDLQFRQLGQFRHFHHFDQLRHVSQLFILKRQCRL